MYNRLVYAGPESQFLRIPFHKTWLRQPQRSSGDLLL